MQKESEERKDASRKYSAPSSIPDEPDSKDTLGDVGGKGLSHVSGSTVNPENSDRILLATSLTDDTVSPPAVSSNGDRASFSASSCPRFASSVLMRSPPADQPDAFRLWLTDSLGLDPSVVGLSLPTAVSSANPSGHLVRTDGQPGGANGMQQTAGTDTLARLTSTHPRGYDAHRRGVDTQRPFASGTAMRGNSDGAAGDVQGQDSVPAVPSVLGGRMGIGEDWNPDAQSAVVKKVAAALEKQVSKISEDTDWLQRQLTGIDDDLQTYRSALMDLRPQKSVAAVEKLVVGGPQFPSRVLMEKLHQGVRVLDSRIETFVRTNSTLFESQLEAIVEQQLTPIRRDVLDLSLALASGSDTALDITKELAEMPRRVNSAVSRYKSDIASLRVRLEELFSETMHHEDLRLKGRLQELKEKEQSRINELNLEERILSTTVEDAIQDMERRGFGILDASSVYRESDAKKVLDLLLYLIDKKKKDTWDVLPVVVVTAPLPPRPVSLSDMKEMAGTIAEASRADKIFGGQDGSQAVMPGGPLSSEPAPQSDSPGARDEPPSLTKLETIATKEEGEEGRGRAASSSTTHAGADGTMQTGDVQSGTDTQSDGGDASSSADVHESLGQKEEETDGGDRTQREGEETPSNSTPSPAESFSFGGGVDHEKLGLRVPEAHLQDGTIRSTDSDFFRRDEKKKLVRTPAGVEWGCQGCEEEMDSISAELDAWLGTGHFLPSKVIQWARSEKPKSSIIPPLFTLQHLVLKHYEASPLVQGGSSSFSSSISTERTPGESSRVSPDETGETIMKGGEGHDDSRTVEGLAGQDAGVNTSTLSNQEEGTLQNTGTVKRRESFVARNVPAKEGYYVLRVDKLLIESFFVKSTGEVTPVPTRYPSSPPATVLGPMIPHSEYGAQFTRAFASLRPSFSPVAPVAGADASLEPLQHGIRPEGGSEGQSLPGSRTTARGDLLSVFRRRTTVSSRTGVAQVRRSLSKVEPVGGNPPKNEDGLAMLARVQQEIAKNRALQSGGSRVMRTGGKSSSSYAAFNPFLCCLNVVEGDVPTQCAHVPRLYGGSFRMPGGQLDRESSVGGEGERGPSSSEKPSGEPEVKGDVGMKASTTSGESSGHSVQKGHETDSSAPSPLRSGEVRAQALSSLSPSSSSLSETRNAASTPPSRQRKVLLAYLGSRTSGLALRYLGGKGRELRRHQLTRMMVEELVSHLDAVCLMAGESTSKTVTDSNTPGVSCGGLQAFTRLGLEAPVWRQLMTMKQELFVSSPTQWGDILYEKTLEDHQIEVFTVYAKVPPPLFLPVTPFFQNNMLLLRVQVGSCNSRGPPKFAIPPPSVLERSLYLLGFPAAGMAAVAGFYYATKAQSRLQRLKEKARAKAAEAFPQLQVSISAMQSAHSEAGLWGRTSGAAEESNWIAHVSVKVGQNASSIIELVDGQASLPRRRTKEPQWWREEIPDLTSSKVNYGTNSARVFVKGRTAGEGEAAKECGTLEDLVQKVGTDMEARVVPRLYASEMRGKRIIVVITTDQDPFEGERLFNSAAMQRRWSEADLLPQAETGTLRRKSSPQGKGRSAAGGVSEGGTKMKEGSTQISPGATLTNGVETKKNTSEKEKAQGETEKGEDGRKKASEGEDGEDKEGINKDEGEKKETAKNGGGGDGTAKKRRKKKGETKGNKKN
ncbi:hypothetical protein CSUI_002605 [Cystoisospora suis]|uniref:Uncharacterized protein n=1 Tax=Cystoisospora suis TaxID=483139 RepID=A0A2C6KHM6_9APIC|nr:hypothetical protein CSUI_002605 [Cystoisospora suis]